MLGLDILWEEIEELPGELIYGGLRMEDKLIVLNERRRALFEQKPGLERSTKGHEMGHWDLFGKSNQAGQLRMFEDDEAFVRRSSRAGDVRVIKALIQTPEGQELLRQIQETSGRPGRGTCRQPLRGGALDAQAADYGGGGEDQSKELAAAVSTR